MNNFSLSQRITKNISQFTDTDHSKLTEILPLLTQFSKVLLLQKGSKPMATIHELDTLNMILLIPSAKIQLCFRMGIVFLVTWGKRV